MFLVYFMAYLLIALGFSAGIAFLIFMYTVHSILGVVVTVILLCALAAWMETT